MKVPKNKIVTGILYTAAITSLSAPAIADLEVQVVTAQKYEQSETDVPIAMSVLDQGTIDNSHAISIEGLQALIPSVSFRTGNTTRNSALTVRGIGTISFSIGAEPSVSTVVDGVVMGRSGQAFGDLYDLERVEILRGPQGTLFGKNASAGVLNITTQRPTEEFTGYAEAAYFEGNERRFKARVSSAISENARASITVLDANFDGYIDNVYTNETVNGYDKQAVRAMVEWDFSDDTTALLIYDDYDAENDCCIDLVARDPGASRPLDSGVAVAAGDFNLDQRSTDTDFENKTLDSTTGLSLQIEKDLGDMILTSITATRNWDNTEFREGDFTSQNGVAGSPNFDSAVDFSTVGFLLHDIGPQEWRQFSQEIRLSSNTEDSLRWQAGLFYWDIDSERNFTRFASCQDTADNQAIVAAANLADPTLGLTCTQGDIVNATAYMDTDFQNYAAFGQIDVDLADTISAFLGLRYTHDEVSFRHNRRNNDEFGRRGVGVRERALDTDLQGNTDDDNLSGKLGVQIDLSNTLTGYLSYARGYKGPAFNVFYNMSANDQNAIDPEESDAIELGVKMLTGNVSANAAIFYTEISDFQANDFDTSDGVTTTGFTNGGDVKTQGIELDFKIAASDNLTISSAIAYADATTDRPGKDVDLPFAPDLNYNIRADYVINQNWSVNAAYIYTDEQLSGNIGQTEDTNPEVLLPDYDIINASVKYTSDDEKLEVSLVGKNLTDETYATTYSGDGFRYQIPRDAERYFGAVARLNF